MLSFKPAFPLSSLTVIKRLFSSFFLSVSRVVISAYLRLLLFLLEILIPACASSRRPHFKILYFIPSAKIFYFKMKLLSKVLDLFIETIGRKAMTNLDSVFNSRGVTLPATVRLVKAVVFPVVMYGCESWTVMKAECRLMDAFEVQCWRRLLRVPWTARRSNHSILKQISP